MLIDPKFLQKLEAQQNWLHNIEEGTLIQIIAMMRDLTFDIESKKYKPVSLWKLKTALGNFKQTKDTTLALYILKFTAG